MTVRSALAVVALHVENGCLGLVARLALWRQQHAPETVDQAPDDLWPTIAVRLTPPPAIVGFCCDQAFTSVEAHVAHAESCRATYTAPVIIHVNPARQARA